jgi:hypothetical protein
MLGVSNFFRAFSGQATVEARLGAIPGAMEGIERVVERSHRAGHFAIAFAMARNDTDAEVIREAAILHDFAEALLWCNAPGLALQIRSRQDADPSLRSAQAQRDVLNIELRDLEQALMRAWRLPELLQQLTNSHQSSVPRVRNVLLATALARHSEQGWDNAALPDDVEAIGRLLNLAPAAVWSMLRELDERAARDARDDGVAQRGHPSRPVRALLVAREQRDARLDGPLARLRLKRRDGRRDA